MLFVVGRDDDVEMQAKASYMPRRAAGGRRHARGNSAIATKRASAASDALREPAAGSSRSGERVPPASVRRCDSAETSRYVRQRLNPPFVMHGSGPLPGGV